MALQKYISNIKSLIAQALKESTKNKLMQQSLPLLNSAKELLEKSDDGENQQQVINCISQLRSAYCLAANKKIGRGLFGEISIENKKIQQDLEQIDFNYKYRLRETHNGLIAYMQFQKKYQENAVWKFVYPTDEQGQQVMNDAIGRWQDKMMEIYAEDHAFVDYNRDIGIENLDRQYSKDGECKAFEKDAIIEKINALVDGASSYKIEQKVLIKDWLRCNGGQDINRFLDCLVADGHFSQKGDGIFESKAIEQHWYNDKGTISCNCDIIVFTMLTGLAKGKNEVIYIDPFSNKRDRGRISSTDVADANYTDNVLLMISNMKNKHCPLPPLLNIKAKIGLEMEGNEVKPKIISLAALSYTDVLKAPLYLLPDVNDSLERRFSVN